MPESVDLKRAAADLAARFTLPSSRRLPTNDSELRRLLREQIAEVLIELMSKDMRRLYAALYRIDIGEERTRAVFEQYAPPEVPDRLADLIIDRQIEKAESQRLYREGRI